MPEAELIDVRVDVREVGLEDLYVDLLDREEAAVESGQALIVRIEASVIPAAPRAPVVEAGPLDFVLAKPISWDEIERALDEALADFAEFSSERDLSLTGPGLRAAASLTVHGELPQPPN